MEHWGNILISKQGKSRQGKARQGRYLRSQRLLTVPSGAEPLGREGHLQFHLSTLLFRFPYCSPAHLDIPVRRGDDGRFISASIGYHCKVVFSIPTQYRILRSSTWILHSLISCISISIESNESLSTGHKCLLEQWIHRI